MTSPDPRDGDLTGVARDAETILDVLRDLEAAGFVGQFMAAREGSAVDEIECASCQRVTPAPAVQCMTLRRLEGASDPDDMLAIAALVCGHCGARGTVVLHYGPQSGPRDEAILQGLEVRGHEQESARPA